jgi:transposase
MYFDYTVKVPNNEKGITKKKIKGTTYVYYSYSRNYNAEKRYTVPKNTTIGKCAEGNTDIMYPNANFIKYFPNAETGDGGGSTVRSSCIRIGAYIIIKKIIGEYGLDGILSGIIPDNPGLFLDLAAYSIITENNAGQYYPDYAYNHPSFTEGMHAYSDATVCRFIRGITRDQELMFQSEWNKEPDSKETIYISYDSTNKGCQSGDIDLVEVGHAKEGTSRPIINFAVAYDVDNSIPLFYEEYMGSIVDVSQLQCMVDKARGYNYSRLCFILDRGYFSEPNIRHMRNCGYDYIIMMKGMKKLVRDTVLEVKGSFEEDYSYCIPKFRTYGTTVSKRLFSSDEKDSYFHIYYSDRKKSIESEKLHSKIEQISDFLEQHEGKMYDVPVAAKKYFEPCYSPNEPGMFLYASKRNDVISDEIKLCGYYVIITSKKMTAAEALTIYKGRDVSEKLFRGDKSYLGNGCYRVQTDESLRAKIFIEFVALIIRNKIYTCLKAVEGKNQKKQKYMNVVAAIKELEKIEIIRQQDGSYTLDHAVTATQKAILKAFNMTASSINTQVDTIGMQLKGQIGEE